MSVSMSWPWSASQVPRVGRASKRRIAASTRIPPRTSHQAGRPRAGQARAARPGRRSGRPHGRRAPTLGRPALRPARGRPPRERLPGRRRPAGQALERLAGGDVVRPPDVDLVVALVHARRLDVVGHVGQPRMGEPALDPGHADLAGPQVLVAVEPAAERRLRVVEVHHHDPADAHPAVDLVDERVDALRSRRSGGRPPTGGPCRGTGRPGPDRRRAGRRPPGLPRAPRPSCRCRRPRLRSSRGRASPPPFRRASRRAPGPRPRPPGRCPPRGRSACATRCGR